MRPLQLVTLSGGLGNQMFQYAFLVHLRRRGARVFPYLGKIRHYGEHNGYELERVFGIALTPGERAMDGTLGVPLLGAAVKHLVFPFKYRERGESDFAANAALAGRHAATRFTGYWQGECFFADVADEVRRLYRFDESRLNAQSRSLAESLRGAENTVSLHVRRGDYYKKDGTPTDFGRAFTADYYDAALAYLANATGKTVAVTRNPVAATEISGRLTENPGRLTEESLRPIVFTDDADWCRAHFPAGFTVVDWNRGPDSWQDMCLMSLCRHHVVANSSFSWWGAWLDARPGGLVVAPRRWKHGAASPDVAPSHWIRL